MTAAGVVRVRLDDPADEMTVLLDEFKQPDWLQLTQTLTGHPDVVCFLQCADAYVRKVYKSDLYGNELCSALSDAAADWLEHQFTRSAVATSPEACQFSGTVKDYQGTAAVNANGVIYVQIHE